MATLEQLKKKLAAKQEKIAKLTAQIKEERCAIAGIRDEIKEAKAPATLVKPSKKTKTKKK